MAMSRIFSQSLSRSSLRPPAALISHHRHRSSKIHNAQIIEVEIDQASSSQTDSPEAAAEVITLGIKKLEDAIHSIVVRRSAPDWLPFLPGYSYWVPPRASAMRGVQHPVGSMIDVIGKLSASGVKRNRGLQLDLLSEDENMAFTSARGWPASAFYIEGTSPVHPIPVVEVEITVLDNEDQSDSTSDSEDAEG
ncbi:hypothetical protein DH2020_039701 [Rehmannia glutinosa]|uniref:Uncharacterized protein n=1 Tax=Rehmannia glutinosa TaxID=99300 RepID=A0ABR0UW93_REHGL